MKGCDKPSLKTKNGFTVQSNGVIKRPLVTAYVTKPIMDTIKTGFSSDFEIQPAMYFEIQQQKHLTRSEEFTCSS
jgi:hypothetical protein